MALDVSIMIDTDGPALPLADYLLLVNAISSLYHYSGNLTLGRDLPQEYSNPYVLVTSGSVLIDLVVNSNADEIAQLLGIFGAAISGTPWLASLPHRVRERWYQDALAAEQAKLAYEEIHRNGSVEASVQRVDTVEEILGAARSRRGRGAPFGRQRRRSNR